MRAYWVAFLLSWTFFCAGHINGALAQDPDLFTGGPTCNAPVVSPDGSQIAFVTDAGGDSDIWIAERNGSDARPLVRWVGSDERDPEWSPDGRTVFFTSTRGTDFRQIWSVTRIGEDPRQLTTDASSNESPRISPDGSAVLFLSDRDNGNRAIWLMDTDGGNQRFLKASSLQVSSPAWSPNGEEIVYVGCSDDFCNLFILAGDLSSMRRATVGNFNDWNPDWWNGKIVFSSDRGGFLGLWTVGSDSSNMQQFTEPGPNGDFEPRWDHRSNTVVFSRTGGSADAAGASIWSSEGEGIETRLTQVLGFLQQGDLNGDGATTCLDLAILRRSFGSRSGVATYDSRADVNGDGIVDVRDLVVVARNLAAGTKCN